MTIAYLRYTLLLLAFSGKIMAQSDGIKISAYTEPDGLSSSLVRCVLQDSRGILWIGTPDGLNTYDGYTFNTLRRSSANKNTIRGNFITKLAEDYVGDIWIGYLNSGVSRYNIATGTFQHYKLQEDSPDKQPQEITALYVDKQNSIWIGMKNNGLLKLDRITGKYTRFNLTTENNENVTGTYNTIYAILEDDSAGFWLATHSGLYHFTPPSNKMRLVKNPSNTEGVDKAIFVNIRRDGNLLWLGSWSGGLASYNIATNEWQQFLYTTRSVTTNIVSDLLPLPGVDSFLVVTNDKGLGYFHKTTHRFRFIYDDEKTATGEYKSLLKDKAANIWIASNKGLIKVWNQTKKFVFHELPVTRSTNNALYAVYKVYETDDFLFYGTWYADGLQVKNKHTSKISTFSIDVFPGEENNMLVMDIKQDKDKNIWVLTRDYLYLFNNKLQKLERKSEAPLSGQNRSNYFIEMTEAANGDLWIASLRNGVFVYNKQQDEFVKHYNPSNPTAFIKERYISTLHKDDDDVIWLGGRNGFLGYVDHTGYIQQVSSDMGGNTVGTINSLTCTQDNQVWIGTDAGLLQLNTIDKKPVRLFTSEHGIVSDIVNKVYTDKNGEIWCITETALCKLNPSQATVSNFGLDEGLEQPSVGNNINTLQDGIMMIPATRGYYLFHPDSLNIPQLPNPIIITSFMVKGEQRFYGHDLGTHQKIMLHPSENQFSFEFASIDFNRNGKQRYSYMLEGQDKEWTDTYSRYAAYANLAPGNYIFKVRSIGNSAQPSDTITTLPIHVSSYFYKTNGFRLGIFFLLLSIVFAVYNIRLRSQRRLFLLQAKAVALEKEKALMMYENLKQQLNPHFLFNSLTSLSSLIRINQKLAVDFLDGLSKIYRYILNNREKELVPLQDEIQFSENYIKLQKTRFEEALRINIQIREEDLFSKIAPVTMQNLIENAIKHNIVTEEEPLEINIYTNEYHQLVIENNLNKKQFVETSNRQGLKNLKSLYSYLSDNPVEIQSDGHLFIVKIPLL